jgi:site-specific DNA recombinase
VVIEYVLGEYPDTPEGNLMKNIRATIAEYERLKISERNTRGRRLKVKSGNVLTHGKSPYGYHLGNGVDGKATLIIFEPEARIVRLIYGRFWRMGARLSCQNHQKSDLYGCLAVR